MYFNSDAFLHSARVWNDRWQARGWAFHSFWVRLAGGTIVNAQLT